MREALKHYSDKYRLCRLWGHPWEPTTVDVEGLNFIQHLRCPRCEMERRVLISRRGAMRGSRNGNRYTRPKDYAIKGGLSVKERNELYFMEVKPRA